MLGICRNKARRDWCFVWLDTLVPSKFKLVLLKKKTPRQLYTVSLHCCNFFLFFIALLTQLTWHRIHSCALHIAMVLNTFIEVRWRWVLEGTDFWHTVIKHACWFPGRALQSSFYECFPLHVVFYCDQIRQQINVMHWSQGRSHCRNRE